MDLSGLKWPLIIIAVVGIGWLGTSGGVKWMYGNFTEAQPGADAAQDLRDEAGLTKLAGYTYHLWKWEKTIVIIQTAFDRYGDQAPNYLFNLERMSNCYDRLGEYQTSYDILQQLMNMNAHDYDERVANNDELALRANKLKEMYDLK